MDVPVAAVDPEPLKLTDSGATPAAVEEEMTAVGGAGGTIMAGAVGVTVVDAILVWPVVSVTVSLAIYEPAVV